MGEKTRWSPAAKDARECIITVPAGASNYTLWSDYLSNKKFILQKTVIVRDT
jgi:hypothetical protein